MAQFAESFHILKEEGEECLIRLYQLLQDLEGTETVREEQDPGFIDTGSGAATTTTSGTSSSTAGQPSRSPRASKFRNSVAQFMNAPKANDGKLAWLAELKQLKKIIVRNFPDTEAFQNEKEFVSDILKDEYGTLTSLEAPIECIQRVCRFREAVKTQLNAFMSRVQSLETDGNYPLSFLFLDVLTTFFKVMHLIQRLNGDGNLFAAVALYSILYKNTKGYAFNGFKRVSNLLQKVYSGATLAVQKDLPGNCAQYLADLLECIRREMRSCENYLDNANGFPFDLVAEVNSSGWASSSASNSSSILQLKEETLYRNFLYFSKFEEWSSIGLLLSAPEARRDSFVDFMKVILKNGFWIHIYRGIKIFLHQEWREWLSAIADINSEYHDQKLVSTITDVKENKQYIVDENVIKELEKEAVKFSPLKHKRRMRVLQVNAKRTVELLQECPGILGPQFFRVCSLLSCLRGEIEWFFLHLCPPPRQFRATRNLYKDEAYENADIMEIVGVCAELAETVRNNKQIIRRYSAKYLSGALEKRFGRALSEVQNTPQLTSNINQTFKHLQSELSKLKAQEGDLKEVSLFSARINWNRCISSIWCSDLYQQLKSRNEDTRKNPLRDLVNAGNKAFFLHSAKVDNLDGFLREFGCLQQLWWYRNAIEKEFQTALVGRKRSVPHFQGSIFKLLIHAPLNCRSSKPKELKEIRDGCASLAKESWLPMYRAAIRHHVTELVTWSAYYNAKADTELSLERFVLLESVDAEATGFDDVHNKSYTRLESTLNKKTRKQLKALGTTPGTENCLSDAVETGGGISDEEGVPSLASAQYSLVNLLNDAKRMNAMCIGNVRIRLHDVVRRELLNSYRQSLQDLQHVSADSLFGKLIPNSINSKFFSKVYRPRYIAKAVETYTEVMLYTVGFGTELSDCIREAYLTELSGPSTVSKDYSHCLSDSESTLSKLPKDLGVVSLVSYTPACTPESMGTSVVGTSLALVIGKQICSFVEDVVGAKRHQKHAYIQATVSCLYSDSTGAYVASPFAFNKIFDVESSLILSKTESTELGALIGVRGWRIISSFLLEIVSEYLRELYGFLSNEAESLQGLLEASTPDQAMGVISKMSTPRLHRAFAILVSIGHALTIRNMLAKSVANALKARTPACGESIQGSRGLSIAALLAALNSGEDDALTKWLREKAAHTTSVNHSVALGCNEGPHGAYGSYLGKQKDVSEGHKDENVALEEVLSLINDIAGVASSNTNPFGGRSGIPDSSLSAVVKNCINHQETSYSTWSLLPVAIAAVLGADVWKRTHFSFPLVAFSNNAHMICPAAHHLLHAMFFAFPVEAREKAATQGIGRHNHETHHSWVETAMERSSLVISSLLEKRGNDVPDHGLVYLLYKLGSFGDVLPQSTLQRYGSCNANLLDAFSVFSRLKQ